MFKKIAAKKDIGLQTLINDALQKLIDEGERKSKNQGLKEELLKDKKFLRKLKTALAA